MRGFKKELHVGLRRKLLFDTIVPVVVLLFILFFAAYHSVRSTINNEVAVELQHLEFMVEDDFNMQYPGDYYKRGTDDIIIQKGSQILNHEYTIIDKIKDNCNVDVTLFYGSMRVITTIRQDGERIDGTEAPIQVKQDVLQQQTAKFYTNVLVNNKPYYAYYQPIYNNDGSCVGMIFIGKSIGEVYRELVRSLLPLIMIGIAGIVIIGIISAYFTDSIVHDVKSIGRLMETISQGKLGNSLEEKVLKREDEIGEIARGTVKMQSSLRRIVERDALTDIYNRRRGTDRLQEIVQKNLQLEMPFQLAIGDIDLFKRVNDTYGHETGDKVLQNVAGILKMNMINRGYAARWGGEEFLLVFENMSYENAILTLNQIMEDIRSGPVILEDGTEVQVTMTFGLVRGEQENSDMLIQKADELLYNGKTNGRNQIITVEGVCNCEGDTINFLTLSTH